MHMRLLTLALIAFACLYHSGSSRAEGGCPPGQYPQSGQGWQTCVPIPGDSASPTAPRAPAWTPRWGAIATDGVKGILGAVDNVDSRASAERRAIANCEAKGGSPCALEESYSNGCGAMAVGSKGFSVASAPTERDAIAKSMANCESDGDSKCQLFYKGCSTPAAN
jgi:hypothetical protein